MLNTFIGTGNVTTDMDLLESPSGKAYCKFTLAINRAGTNNKNQQADFIPCLAWDNQAKAIAKYCSKGSKMTIVGSLQTTSWTDKNGNKRSGFQIVVEKQDFLSSKTEEDNQKTTRIRREDMRLEETDDTIFCERPPF